MSANVQMLVLMIGILAAIAFVLKMISVKMEAATPAEHLILFRTPLVSVSSARRARSPRPGELSRIWLTAGLFGVASLISYFVTRSIIQEFHTPLVLAGYLA